MPAPDVPPPPEFAPVARPVLVHLHARLVAPGDLAGGVVVVIDNLRAGVTITAALAHGASCVVPAFTVADALEAKRRLVERGTRPEDIVLGGERGGVLIPGFDLDNSPARYTPERVAGKIVVFTTTNGTAALLHAARADRVLVGSFANLSAVCAAVAAEARPVHILCAGTREQISLDDVLPAGAMAERLLASGRGLGADDSGRVAMAAWRGVLAQPGGRVAAMRSSRGGRNLNTIGLGADVEFCAASDTLAVVPRFDMASNRITLGG